MEKYKIGSVSIRFYGKVRGANSNKFNRVNKLASMYNELNSKLHRMAEKGSNSCSEIYRCSVATLLLMETGIRVGNEGSAEGYNTVPHPHAKNQESKFVQTYGLTTLLQQHVIHTNKKSIEFSFLGKKQVENTFKVPQNLYKYVKDIYVNCDKNPLFGITDYQLTKFIKRYVGKDFTPKDFRTLRANIYAEESISSLTCIGAMSMHPTKKEVKEVIKSVCIEVSEKLNNTPGVCKKSYINELLFTENLDI